MNKRYVIDTIPNSTTVAIYRVPKGAEIISGGTMVEPMSIQYKTTEYEKYREQYGIAFIFEDNIPVIDFYTVPLINVFATDSFGGFFGRLETSTEISCEEPICYINQKKDCFIVANSANEFLRFINEGLWENILKTTKKTNQIVVYKSKADAEESGVMFLGNQQM